MRIVLLAAVAALGLAVGGSSAALAAPSYGTSIGAAAAKVDLKQDVWWRRTVIIGGGCGWCCRHPRRC